MHGRGSFDGLKWKLHLKKPNFGVVWFEIIDLTLPVVIFYRPGYPGKEEKNIFPMEVVSAQSDHFWHRKLNLKIVTFNTFAEPFAGWTCHCNCQKPRHSSIQPIFKLHTDREGYTSYEFPNFREFSLRFDISMLFWIKEYFGGLPGTVRPLNVSL